MQRNKRKFKYTSAFDIIGPIMIGPSSSHTAGAVKIGKMARALFEKKPVKLTVTFYGSFAETYKGHGTAVAIVAGVIGFETNDERIPEAIQLAESQGIKIEFVVSQVATDHSNTVSLELTKENEKLNLTAISIGGGSIQLVELNHHLISLTSPEKSGFILGAQHLEPIIPMLENELNQLNVKKLHCLINRSLYLVETNSDINPKILKKIRELPRVKIVLPITE